MKDGHFVVYERSLALVEYEIWKLHQRNSLWKCTKEHCAGAELSGTYNLKPKQFVQVILLSKAIKTGGKMAQVYTTFIVPKLFWFNQAH
jgi:hypothetical protein